MYPEPVVMDTIRTEREGDVLIVTIDHPTSDMNAVDEQLHHDLWLLFRELVAERDARAVVLTGAGRAFSAGGDMAWFPQLRAPDRLHALRREGKQLIWNLLDVEIPVVAALNGPAVGLGASVALMCDVIVMAETASIVDPHVQVGLVAGDGGTAIWPLLVGPLAAKRHLLLGDPLGADEAVRLGVASEVCAVDDVLAVARRWANRLAAQPPLAVQATKLAVNAQIKQALLTSFDVAMALEMSCFHSDDHAEAVAAFVEKRTPRFRGR
jgi:enoyl-CoA hydratase